MSDDSELDLYEKCFCLIRCHYQALNVNIDYSYIQNTGVDVKQLQQQLIATPLVLIKRLTQSGLTMSDNHSQIEESGETGTQEDANHERNEEEGNERAGERNAECDVGQKDNSNQYETFPTAVK